jgi:hypothetical protein
MDGDEAESVEDEPMEDELVGSEAAVPEPEASAPTPNTVPPPPAAAATPAPSGSPTAAEEEPLWQRLARQREERRATPASSEAPQSGAAPDGPSSVPSPAPSEPEPLWKRFAESGRSTEPPVPPRTSAPNPTPSPSPPSAPPAAAGDPADRPSEPLARLETRLLGASATERRDWYVGQLCSGSEPEYRRILEQLDAAPSWTEATQIIAREIFRKNQVNIYSDAAIAFTDAVEARFTRGR